MTPTSTARPVSPARFLITGAKGFIGAWIARELVDRGDRPFVFDIDTESSRVAALLTPEQMSAVTLIQGDITQYRDVEKAVLDYGITHVLHLAGIQVPFCAADPVRGAMINVIGTLNVFEVARKHRDQLKHVVYASSAAVFGPEEAYGHETVREGAPLLPRTHYGVFKQCNEGNARVYFQNDGISSAGIRPGTVYGVGRDRGMTSGPTKAIKATVIGRPYTIAFTGGMDMQYVRDVARLFIRAGETALPGARYYTVRGNPTQVADFLTALGSVLPESKTLISAKGNTLPVAYDFDDATVRQDFGDPNGTRLDDGIRETADIFSRLHRAGTLDTKDLET
jgi:nucleoside-diphosphate-sugar epimerase